MSFKHCSQWCICLSTVTSEPACWCIFIRTGEDAEVSKFFNVLVQFFPIFPTLSPGKSLSLLLFSHLQKLPMVTTCLQVFALSFVPLRCLVKTIHDNYRAAVLLQIRVWKNRSCWSLLLPVPRAFSALQKRKQEDCFRVFFSSPTKECVPLVPGFRCRSLAHWLLFTVFLAIVHCIAGWKASFLLLSAYHSSICFQLLEISIWHTPALFPCLINSFNFVASENNGA